MNISIASYNVHDFLRWKRCAEFDSSCRSHSTVVTSLRYKNAEPVRQIWRNLLFCRTCLIIDTAPRRKVSVGKVFCRDIQSSISKRFTSAVDEVWFVVRGRLLDEENDDENDEWRTFTIYNCHLDHRNEPMRLKQIDKMFSGESR